MSAVRRICLECHVMPVDDGEGVLQLRRKEKPLNFGAVRPFNRKRFSALKLLNEHGQRRLRLLNPMMCIELALGFKEVNQQR